MVRSFAAAIPVMIGLREVAGMMTLLQHCGTWLKFQLQGLCQSSSTAPVQVSTLPMLTEFVAVAPPVTQLALDCKSTVMTSLEAINGSKYRLELLPTVIPFFFQTYCGLVPPLIGVAVKVIAAETQDAPGELLMETDGVIVVAENESVMVLLVALVVLKQVALLVKTQFTSSPETGDDNTYVALFAPVAMPFLYH